MRYIKKRPSPPYIAEWKDLRTATGQNLSYEDFSYKPQLNDDLREDQHHICCYCQQKIMHFQGSNIGGSHNEHLVPEGGSHGDFALQIDYSNLFACCNTTNGMGKKQKSKRHCGDAKGDKLIKGYIQDTACSSYFKYNNLGEILPNGSYRMFEEYKANRATLTNDEREALETLEVLNLNSTLLVNDRKKDFDRFLGVLTRLSKAIINKKIAEFESSTHYPRYIDMLLYYMRLKKEIDT